jgi:enterochelin esterase-like enzyme
MISRRNINTNGIAVRALLVVLMLVGCGVSGLAQPRRSLTEEFRVHRAFHSKFLTRDRDVVVWLPPGYDSEPGRRYAVFYMLDGGDVFVSWRLDEIAKPLITSGEIEPLIIVMIVNNGSQDDRTDEYGPTRPSGARHGGQADAFGRMLVEELKPLIDTEYRTLTDSAHTGLGGFSLGGLASLYLGLKPPKVFGKLAAVSPAVWWDNKLIVRNVKALDAKPPTRIWLDIGTGEGSSVDAVKDVRDALVKKGWVLDSDLRYYEAKGGTHDYKSFVPRGAPILKYLFPASQ